MDPGPGWETATNEQGESYYFKQADHSSVTWDIQDTFPFRHEEKKKPDACLENKKISALNFSELPSYESNNEGQEAAQQQGLQSYRSMYLNCYSSTDENRKVWQRGENHSYTSPREVILANSMIYCLTSPIVKALEHSKKELNRSRLIMGSMSTTSTLETEHTGETPRMVRSVLDSRSAGEELRWQR